VPTIRVERNGSGKPISTLAPFLVWPRVLDKNDITASPYIVDAKDAKLLIETGKTVYVKGLAHTRRGDGYAVYHPGKDLKDPDTGETIGVEVEYGGYASVVRPDTVSKVTIEQARREIRRGDRLIKLDNKPRDMSLPIQAPNKIVRGTVMALFDAELISGQRMVATINRGARDGIKPGYTLGVYTHPHMADDPYEKTKGRWHTKEAVKVELPPERVATMVIYDVSDRISYGIITESDHPVKKGFKIGNP